jgi:hypothetical protein
MTIPTKIILARTSPGRKTGGAKYQRGLTRNPQEKK